MVLFPNCKVNLGLSVVAKRQDGYHDIETIFYPLPLYDAMEVIKKPNTKGNYGELSAGLLSTSGLDIHGDPKNNICRKAYALLRHDFPDIINSESTAMHLHKVIPSGAGLGGGSADGAFTIKLLNQKFDLQLSGKQLLDYAMQLGSDCPFFIINKPCFATGRGEILKTIQLDLSAYKFVIVNPAIHISTGEAFSLLTPHLPSKSLKEIIQQPVQTWKDELKNDFEYPVFKNYPGIGAIKEKLYEAGASYASITGSGSTVYGLFEKNKTPQLSFPKNYFVRELGSQLQ